MFGPWLPIYGTGALLILFSTLPVSGNSILIFLFGMVTATILEYVTGTVMEHIFKIRYWDYSEEPLNVNGYVCLKASLAWGLFSLLLVRVLHPPVNRFICYISGWRLDLLSLVLTVLFGVDLIKSIQTALGFRTLLAKLMDSKRLMNHLNGKLDVLTDKLSENSVNLRQRLLEIDEVQDEWIEKKKIYFAEKKLSRKIILMEKIREYRIQQTRLLSRIQVKTDSALLEVNTQLEYEENSLERERLSRTAAVLSEFIELIQKEKLELSERKDRDFQRAISILARNPGVCSERYQQEIMELKSLDSKEEFDRKNTVYDKEEKEKNDGKNKKEQE